MSEKVLIVGQDQEIKEAVKKVIERHAELLSMEEMNDKESCQTEEFCEHPHAFRGGNAGRKGKIKWERR